jgi:hypothetical protein
MNEEENNPPFKICTIIKYNYVILKPLRIAQINRKNTCIGNEAVAFLKINVDINGKVRVIVEIPGFNLIPNSPCYLIEFLL